MRIGEKIYHCRRISDNEGNVSYAEPVEITLRLMHCTVQPESGYTALMQYGEQITEYQRMVLYPYAEWRGKVNVGDVFYLDGENPLPLEPEYGAFANYIVDNVMNQNMAIVVKLKRRP